MSEHAANNRYTIWTVACFTAFLAINGLAESGAFKTLQGPLLAVLGIVVAIPIAAHVWATWSLIQNMDEFGRALSAKRFVIGWGICLILFSTAGFMTSYAGVPPVPGQWLYVMFFVVVGIISLFVHSTR